MISFVQKYGGNVHSQNGEDGIISECVKRLGIEKGFCVEVGSNDGLWLSNTRLLIESGWSGRMIEADYNLYRKCCENWKDKPVISSCCKVDGRTINIFVDDKCDVLSLDTDGKDYEIFKGLKAKPKIVIIEIDSSLPPDEVAFNSDGGSSYRAMVELGISKGYFVLAHTGNIVFIGDDFRKLFPEIIGDGLDSELYFNRSWLRAEAA